MKQYYFPPPSLYKDTYGQFMEKGYFDKWVAFPRPIYNRNLQVTWYDALIKQTGHMTRLVNRAGGQVLPISNINKTL